MTREKGSELNPFCMDDDGCDTPKIDHHANKSCLSQHTLNAQTEMRSTNVLCDACIRLDDGGCIYVHRVIMCAASDYFRYFKETKKPFIIDKNKLILVFFSVCKVLCLLLQSTAAILKMCT